MNSETTMQNIRFQLWNQHQIELHNQLFDQLYNKYRGDQLLIQVQDQILNRLCDQLKDDHVRY